MNAVKIVQQNYNITLVPEQRIINHEHIEFNSGIEYNYMLALIFSSFIIYQLFEKLTSSFLTSKLNFKKFRFIDNKNEDSDCEDEEEDDEEEDN
jgi:hypothetical protein